MSNPHKNITEEALVKLLKAKDKEGLEWLYDHYSKALYGVIYRIVGDKNMAEEVLQNTYLKIWNKAGDYNVRKGRLFTWMLNIARNAAIDKTRSRDFKESKNNQKLEDHFKMLEMTVKKENLKTDTIDLYKFTEKLEPSQQAVVDLIYLKGYTQSEAAKELEIPLGTVKTKVRSALINLRKWMLML